MSTEDATVNDQWPSDRYIAPFVTVEERDRFKRDLEQNARTTPQPHKIREQISLGFPRVAPRRGADPRQAEALTEHVAATMLAEARSIPRTEAEIAAAVEAYVESLSTARAADAAAEAEREQQRRDARRCPVCNVDGPGFGHVPFVPLTLDGRRFSVCLPCSRTVAYVLAEADHMRREQVTAWLSTQDASLAGR